MRPRDAKMLPDHPLVGTRWASNNGHYPLRVVMAVCEQSHGRLSAQLTNNIPGMKTWRLLTDDGRVTGHHQIAPADPDVARLAAQFRGIPGLNVADVAEVLRYPNYDPLPGPGSSNPKAKVELRRDGLIALGERLAEMARIIEQNALASGFDNPAAGYDSSMFSLKAIEEADAQLERASELLEAP